MADPGFPVGGVDPLGGAWTLTWVLYGKNVCENERIGSHSVGGGGMNPARPLLDPPMLWFSIVNPFVT